MGFGVHEQQALETEGSKEDLMTDRYEFSTGARRSIESRMQDEREIISSFLLRIKVTIRKILRIIKTRSSLPFCV